MSRKVPTLLSVSEPEGSVWTNLLCVVMCQGYPEESHLTILMDISMNPRAQNPRVRPWWEDQDSSS